MVARADVVQSTLTLPPPTGVLALQNACISSVDRCVENAAIFDISVTSDNQVAGNEVVMATAAYSAIVTTDNGGSPGTPLGPVFLTGAIEFIYVGRNPGINPLGDFTTLVPSFDFKGTFNGNIQEVTGMATTGTTSISQLKSTPPILYTVTSQLEFSGGFTINGGPFIPAYSNTAILISVPEPGYGAPSAVLLAGVLAIRRRRHRTVR
jgi:hypothetical protein